MHRVYGRGLCGPGYNVLVLETTDPQEFLHLFAAVRANPPYERALRRAGRLTAQHYAWPQIIQHLLLPRLRAPALASQADTGRADATGRWRHELTGEEMDGESVAPAALPASSPVALRVWRGEQV
jgi:hypothetical protein